MARAVLLFAAGTTGNSAFFRIVGIVAVVGVLDSNCDCDDCSQTSLKLTRPALLLHTSLPCGYSDVIDAYRQVPTLGNASHHPPNRDPVSPCFAVVTPEIAP